MMFKRLTAAWIIVVFSTGSAHAANCSAYTYTLTNGTTADANQVMSNFNNILNCGNNNLAGLASPSFTGTVGIGSPGSGAESLSITGTAVLGNSTEKLSLNSGSLGFNRRVSTGQIYNTSAYAYQFQHNPSTVAASDNLHISIYSPSGSSVASPLVMNGVGQVGINGGPSGSYTFFVNGSAAGTSVWTNTSDARLKKNIVEVSGALALVLKLRGVRYDWRTAGERSVGKNLPLPTSERQIGFVAQEVEKVVPEAVSKPKDAAGIYGLKPENLIPVLVEAIKEQQAEIEKLQNSLAALAPTTRH